MVFFFFVFAFLKKIFLPFLVTMAIPFILNLPKYLHANLSVFSSSFFLLFLFPCDGNATFYYHSESIAFSLNEPSTTKDFFFPRNNSSLAPNCSPVFWPCELVEQVIEAGNDVVFALEMINNSADGHPKAPHI